MDFLYIGTVASAKKVAGVVLLLTLFAVPACGDDDDGGDDDLISGDDDASEEAEPVLICGVEMPLEQTAPTVGEAYALARASAVGWASDARLVWVFSSYIHAEGDSFTTDVLPDGRLPIGNEDRSKWIFVFQSDSNDVARDIMVDAQGQVTNDAGDERTGQQGRATITGFTDSDDVLALANENGGCEEIAKHPADWRIRMELSGLPVQGEDRALYLWNVRYTHWVEGEENISKIGGWKVTVNADDGELVGQPEEIPVEE